TDVAPSRAALPPRVDRRATEAWFFGAAREVVGGPIAIVGRRARIRLAESACRPDRCARGPSHSLTRDARAMRTSSVQLAESGGLGSPHIVTCAPGVADQHQAIPHDQQHCLSR